MGELKLGKPPPYDQIVKEYMDQLILFIVLEIKKGRNNNIDLVSQIGTHVLFVAILAKIKIFVHDNPIHIPFHEKKTFYIKVQPYQVQCLS